MSRHREAWRTDVVVLRGGGRDSKGNPLPVVEIPATDCFVGPRAASEPLDRSNGTDGKAVLLREPGVKFMHTDRIRVPEPHLMAGEWSVDGRPGEWPKGVEIALVRA